MGVPSPLGDPADIGLAEVAAGGVLAKVDLDAAVLGRDACRCRLVLFSRAGRDDLVKRVDTGSAGSSSEAEEDFLVKNPPA